MEPHRDEKDGYVISVNGRQEYGNDTLDEAEKFFAQLIEKGAHNVKNFCYAAPAPVFCIEYDNKAGDWIHISN